MYLYILFLAVCLLCLWQWLAARPRGAMPLANDGALTVGEHQGGRLTGYRSDAPTTVRFQLVKQGATDNTFTVPTSIADLPVGVCYDEANAITDPVHIQMFDSAGRTIKMVAAGAIAAGSIVVTNGDGRVRQLPTTAGIYYAVGRAVTTAVLANDLLEVDAALQQWGVSIVT